MPETTDKFDVLLTTLQAWAQQQQPEPRQTSPQLVLKPDGSGRLEDNCHRSQIEFADVSEVVGYMQRRIAPKPTVDHSDSIFDGEETQEHRLDELITKTGTGV